MIDSVDRSSWRVAAAALPIDRSTLRAYLIDLRDYNANRYFSFLCRNSIKQNLNGTVLIEREGRALRYSFGYTDF